LLTHCLLSTAVPLAPTSLVLLLPLRPAPPPTPFPYTTLFRSPLTVTCRPSTTSSSSTRRSCPPPPTPSSSPAAPSTAPGLRRATAASSPSRRRRRPGMCGTGPTGHRATPDHGPTRGIPRGSRAC